MRCQVFIFNSKLLSKAETSSSYQFLFLCVSPLINPQQSNPDFFFFFPVKLLAPRFYRLLVCLFVSHRAWVVCSEGTLMCLCVRACVNTKFFCVFFFFSFRVVQNVIVKKGNSRINKTFPNDNRWFGSLRVGLKCVHTHTI